MNPLREVFTNGAVAVRGPRIVAVGPSAEVTARYRAAERIEGSAYVITPGLVNAHIHASTEPLTRGAVPDDTSFEANVFGWLSPLAAAYTEDDERLATTLGAVDMLTSGTTTFLEAGTGWHVDAVVEGVLETGIRARVSRRVWDRPAQPHRFRQSTDQAIAALEDIATRHAGHADGRIRASTTVVGHTTCSDPLWRAAREIADRHGTGLNFHMSPTNADPYGFLSEFGERPFVHLDRLGVLGPDAVAVHCVYVDDDEVSLLAASGTNVAHCPATALKVAYGVSQVGKFPEMLAAGVHLCVGTDGNNAANFSDLYRAAYLVAGLHKDARRDPTLFPAETAFEMATLGGARALLMADEIGSIEAGKRADLVLHDRDRPEWNPLLNIANQLVYSIDGRSVHTVFVDGKKVVADHRPVAVDTDQLYRQAEHSARALIARAGLQVTPRWPHR
jgi:cytosine/adenosine deaminase-related metal-dependent hydrolase